MKKLLAVASLVILLPARLEAATFNPNNIISNHELTDYTSMGRDAIQGPIILMSQNRQSEIDRLRSEYDYTVNRKAEREIEKVREELAALHKKIDEHIIVK